MKFTGLTYGEDTANALAHHGARFLSYLLEYWEKNEAGQTVAFEPPEPYAALEDRLSVCKKTKNRYNALVAMRIGVGFDPHSNLSEESAESEGDDRQKKRKRAPSKEGAGGGDKRPGAKSSR